MENMNIEKFSEMAKEYIAKNDKENRLLNAFINKIRKEQPAKEITPNDVINLKYAIKVLVSQGKTEQEIEQYCLTEFKFDNSYVSIKYLKKEVKKILKQAL